MGTNIKLKIDPADKILLKRNLNRNGKGQQFFTHEVRRLSDPYVPFLSGTLKDTAQELTTGSNMCSRTQGGSIMKTAEMDCADRTGQSACGQTVEKRSSSQ